MTKVDAKTLLETNPRRVWKKRSGECSPKALWAVSRSANFTFTRARLTPHAAQNPQPLTWRIWAANFPLKIIMADTFYGTGKRKDAIARVWLTPGTGNITVNGKIRRGILPSHHVAAAPALPAGSHRRAAVRHQSLRQGGGTTGQLGAVRHGIAKALVLFNEEFRGDLREIGSLTRDPRVKERKKYGRKARPSRLPVLEALKSVKLQTASKFTTAVFCLNLGANVNSALLGLWPYISCVLSCRRSMKRRRLIFGIKTQPQCNQSM
jgi:small subunit ribosomal protein S9